MREGIRGRKGRIGLGKRERRRFGKGEGTREGKKGVFWKRKMAWGRGV